MSNDARSHLELDTFPMCDAPESIGNTARMAIAAAQAVLDRGVFIPPPVAAPESYAALRMLGT